MSEDILPGDQPIGPDRSARPGDRRRIWSAAFASGAAHALLLALLIGLWHPATEENPPLRPVRLVLLDGDGASGAAGGGAGETSAAASSASSESPAPATPPSPPAQATSTEMAQQAVPVPPAPPAEAPPAEAPLPPPVAAMAQSSAAAAEPIPSHKPAPPHPRRSVVAARTFAPAQAEASATAATESAASASAAPTAIASANASTSEPDAGGRGRGEEGAGRAALGNGSHEGLGDDYLEKIRRWLSRYQKMPEEAAQKKQYGTAVVSITLDRAGNVLDAQIEKSSGYPLLDAATLQMVHDASPLPKVPETFKNNELEIAVPANYRPGFFESLFR